METASEYRYFPISPDDVKWGLYITTCGRSFIAPDSPYPPRSHPAGYNFAWSKGRVLREYCLVYILKGDGVLESQSLKKSRISAGSLFMLFPGEWHRYRPSEKTGWTEYWIGFSGDYAVSTAKKFFSVKEPVVNVGADEDILSCYSRILEVGKSEPVGYQQIMAGHAVALLGHFYRGLKGRGTVMKEADLIIHRAKCLIIESLAEVLDPNVMAKELNVGYSWLRRTFKHYTGLPLLQYQLQMRIHKARGMLENSSIPIYAIAEQCGFESGFYFSRMFKKKTGLTPSACREQAKRA